MTYNIKQRVLSLCGFLFLVIISISVFYAGVYLISKYNNYSPTIIFTEWGVFAVFFPLFFIPYALMLTPVFINGKSISEKKAKKLIKTSLCFLLLTAISMVLFSAYYKESLKQRGYVECQGTPSGWTPGMATKYTINKNYCIKID